MTKKFWRDWKRRIGETRQVYLCRQKTKWFDYQNSLDYAKDLLDLWRGERILSYKFNGDTIDFVIERKHYVNDGHFNWHYHVENEYLTIKRKDIVSVEFKKYNTEGNTRNNNLEKLP